jgi:hypothetical protein
VTQSTKYAPHRNSSEWMSVFTALERTSISKHSNTRDYLKLPSIAVSAVANHKLVAQMRRW